MKKYVLLPSLFIASLLCSQSLRAQGVAVNTSGAAANSSAMLDVNSTTQGILIPRMTSVNIAGIANPATGLMVYQTDGTPGFYYNSGTPAAPAWTFVINSASNVTTQGNSFNGNSQLVQTTSAGNLPAIDGSAVTNLNGANLQTNSVTVDKLPSGGSSTTYLNGAGQWATPSSSGGGATVEVIASIDASTTTASIASNASSTLNYDHITTNVGSSFNGTTFTVPSTGMYLVTASYSASNIGHTDGLSILVNGSAVEYGEFGSNNSGTTPNTCMATITTVLSLTSTNTLAISCFSGNSTSTTNTNGTSRLTITKLQ